MQGTSGGMLFSATDLVAHMHCEHLTNLERRSADEGSLSRSTRHDPLLEALAARGFKHEDNLLEIFVNKDLKVIDLSPDRDDPDHIPGAAEQTIEAMRSGIDVIYQATFVDAVSVGHADYLVRIDGKSALGGYHYEVWDTKLARHVKADALLQLSDYTNHLTRIQQRRPELMTVVTGDLQAHMYRVNDFVAFYRRIKGELLRTIQEPRQTYPDRNSHCSVCSWLDLCTSTWRYSDDLKAVWGLSTRQRQTLIIGGIPTTAALAAADSAKPVKHVGQETFQRLQSQASLQVLQRRTGRPLYRLLPTASGDRGLGALPEPDAGDFFFDFEGDPLETSEGLEYLFGLHYRENNEDVYIPKWAHSRDQEKTAFEWFIQTLQKRVQDYPDMHVYHYGVYEQSALIRLAQRHGVYWTELEAFLREGRFVDLYTIVRKSMQTSKDSLGLKAMESFYLGKRTQEVADAASSIVVYEQWLRSQDQKLLDDIADYNEVDVKSLLGLQTFLEPLRQQLLDEGNDIPRPTPHERSEDQLKIDSELDDVYKQLTETAINGPGNVEIRAKWLVAQLLDWHRREATAEWQEFFRRSHMSKAELAEDSHCLSSITLDEDFPPMQVDRSTVFTYRFDTEEEHSFRLGDLTIDPSTGKTAGKIVEIDQSQGLISLKRGRTSGAHPGSLIPTGPVDTSVLRKSLLEFGKQIATEGFDSTSNRALKDLLLQNGPRLKIERPGPLVPRRQSPQLAALRTVANLDSSCLVVQGPPGSGKTTVGAAAVLQAVQRGQRVAICAFSHAAISNLVEAVAQRADKENIALRVLYRASGGSLKHNRVFYAQKNEQIAEALGEVEVIAGTPWLFARPELKDKFDLLVLDEAGQMSLANAVAIGSSSKNLLLLGDPQQLQQPAKARHPEGAEVSAMRHFMGDAETVPRNRGILLNVTRRLNSSSARLTSEISYDGRLRSHPSAAQQHLVGNRRNLGGKGMRFVSVTHTDNRVTSPEEVDTVVRLFKTLIGRDWVDASGNLCTIFPKDILVMAPFNTHVSRLKAALPDGARVGSVDKFQGQESAISIYSLASSSPEDVPRGIDFLLSRNRMNVATSRARVMSFVVASPGLLVSTPKSIEQMRMINALCMIAESYPAFNEHLQPARIETPRRSLPLSPHTNETSPVLMLGSLGIA